MAPPAGGAAAAAAAPVQDPGSAAVLLAVRAAVRPLGAEPDAEAQMRRLQLRVDPERPGRFRLELLGAGPRAPNLQWPLESVSYTVRSPSQHELQPPPGGPGALSLHFPNPQEAQRWAALIRGATTEGQDGRSSPPPVLLSLPSPPKAPTPKGPEADPPWSPRDLMEKEELVEHLAQAVASGDEKGAARAAAMLAQKQVALSVQLPETYFPPGPVRLQVTVEDAASSAHVSLQAHPHCTIATLQDQVFLEYGFPPAVQRWVIGQCLCVPERSLASYGVQRDGDPAFLYLLSAPRKAAGHSPQLPQLLGLPRVPQPAGTRLPRSLQHGWPCPSCTFINALSRPGCEMCSTQRPCAWDPLPSTSTQQPPKVTRREDGPALPGPWPLEPLLDLSGDVS